MDYSEWEPGSSVKQQFHNNLFKHTEEYFYNINHFMQSIWRVESEYNSDS